MIFSSEFVQLLSKFFYFFFLHVFCVKFEEEFLPPRFTNQSNFTCSHLILSGRNFFCAQKSLHFQHRLLLDSRYIGARNSQVLCNLPLRPRPFSQETISHTDDRLLLLAQAGLKCFIKLPDVLIKNGVQTCALPICTTSTSEIASPSLSRPIGSNSETSRLYFFPARKSIRISFSMHFAEYVASFEPRSG